MTEKKPDYRKLFDLSGRIALVIGGASGIGQAGAEAMAAFGATSVIADLAIEKESSSSRHVDVTSTESVDDLISKVLSDHRRIDVLLVTPARNMRKRLTEYSDADFDAVIDLNLKGTFRAARAVAKPMMQQKAGSIILLSSIRSVNVEAGQSIYAATKSGIALMAKALAAELAPSNVRVNALAPGIVDTPLTRPITSNPQWKEAYASRSALGRWASASEMAGPIVFLASDASSYVTGTVIFADGGWTAVDGRYQPPV
jgi:NAD(P)-dependent dehydrogenase (short-subunit alcohol dehydrogenase family)